MHDSLVIGGGVIGLSLAYELAKAGLSVRVVDRGPVGREASWAGAGILPPAVYRPDDHPYEQLKGISHQLHPALAAELREATGIDSGYRRCGGIYIARGEAAVRSLDELATWWGGRDICVEKLDGQTLATAEPLLASSADSSSQPIDAALLVPDEAQLRNPRHLKALTQACLQRGVQITPGTAIDDFDVRTSRIQAAMAGGERIVAGSFCMATGCWSAALARRLGLGVAIKPVRGQMVLLRTLGGTPGRVVNEDARYIVPRDDGRVLVGSTEEDAGFDCSTTASGIAGLLAFALSLCTALGSATVERTWAGLRPGSADGLPYLGRAGDLENAFVAAGHFRSGLHLSPGTARVMAQVMREEPTQIDLAPLSPDRP